jgi:hypothetical protein
VETLQRVVVDHNLAGSDIFIFTDNSMAEATFWKGTSKLRKQFELVLHLKKLKLKHGLILHVIHVSGRHMLAQGMDGLSRADHSKDIMKGKDMRVFIPLHLTPTAREPKVKPWLDEATKGLNFKWLTLEGWFIDAHVPVNFV